jgi:hypothetical protein
MVQFRKGATIEIFDALLATTDVPSLSLLLSIDCHGIDPYCISAHGLPVRANLPAGIALGTRQTGYWVSRDAKST